MTSCLRQMGPCQMSSVYIWSQTCSLVYRTGFCIVVGGKSSSVATASKGKCTHQLFNNSMVVFPLGSLTKVLYKICNMWNKEVEVKHDIVKNLKNYFECDDVYFVNTMLKIYILGIKTNQSTVQCFHFRGQVMCWPTWNIFIFVINLLPCLCVKCCKKNRIDRIRAIKLTSFFTYSQYFLADCLLTASPYACWLTNKQL